MKFVELTEYSTSTMVLVNLERVDFIIRHEDMTSLRIGDDEFAVCETPEQILKEFSKSELRRNLDG